MQDILDQKIIDAELQKPIEIDKEVKRSLGKPTDGTERQSYYTLRDKWIISKEAGRIYRSLVDGVTPPKPGDKKIFYISAGGPGSGKTKLIGATLSPQDAVHLDPDEVVLKKFKPYQRAIEVLGESDVCRTVAYSYWRWASIFINNSLINRLANEGYNIAFGTTGTSPATAKIYTAAKQAGYETRCMMCHAPEDVRVAGAQKRFEVERRFIPQQDVLDKGNKLFPDAVMLHIDNADHVAVYWRAHKDAGPVLAAETKDGKWHVRDAVSYQAFLNELSLRKPDVDWQSIGRRYESRFAKTAVPAPAAKM